MTKEVFDWIVLASVLSPLIPLICLSILRKGQPKQNLILAVSLFISFSFDVGGVIWQHYNKQSNLFPNLWVIVAFPAIMWFYHETMIKRSLKMIIRIFTVGFLIVALIFAFQQGLHGPNYKTLTLSSILVTITSFFFVADLNLMDESSFLKNRFHETNIMLNSSLAIYYFFTTILFAISDYVFSHTTQEGAYAFWACHNGLNISKNLGVTVAFYLTARRSTQLGNYQKI